MTSERLNDLQVQLAQADEQIRQWSAKRALLQGQLEECAISVGGLHLAEAFTGWLPALRPLTNGHDVEAAA